MSISGRIEMLWSAKFWDALGCGASEDDANRIANSATANLRGLLAAVERAQAPQLPRFSNLAGRRQAALRRA